MGDHFAMSLQFTDENVLLNANSLLPRLMFTLAHEYTAFIYTIHLDQSSTRIKQ